MTQWKIVAGKWKIIVRHNDVFDKANNLVLISYINNVFVSFSLQEYNQFKR